VSTPISTFDDLEDGTDLAVVLSGGKIERWEWRDGAMQKDGTRLPTFFFSGLLTEQKIMPGNFSPPVRGEWFALTGDNTHTWCYLVIRERSDRLYRCGYFRRGEFYDWREVSQGDLLDSCVRVEAPDWSSDQFMNMTARCSDAQEAQAEAEKRERNTRGARQSVAYARDYIARALEQMERTT
jgi:hypothetical protein